VYGASVATRCSRVISSVINSIACANCVSTSLRTHASISAQMVTHNDNRCQHTLATSQERLHAPDLLLERKRDRLDRRQMRHDDQATVAHVEWSHSRSRNDTHTHTHHTSHACDVPEDARETIGHLQSSHACTRGDHMSTHDTCNVSDTHATHLARRTVCSWARATSSFCPENTREVTPPATHTRTAFCLPRRNASGVDSSVRRGACAREHDAQHAHNQRNSTITRTEDGDTVATADAGAPIIARP
jgi:hypothetical protein